MRRMIWLHVLAEWRNHLSAAEFTWGTDFRQAEIYRHAHTVKPQCLWDFIRLLKSRRKDADLLGELIKIGLEKSALRHKESILFRSIRRPKTDYSNFRNTSLLSTTYKILSNFLLSRLTPCAEEISGNHQCVFGRHRSTADHILCIP